MKLFKTIGYETLMQWRAGFYLAYAVVTFAFILALRMLPSDISGWLLPLLLVSDPAIFGYFLAGVVVILEREGHVRETLTVTPMGAAGYIGGKAVSILLLSTAVTLTMALFGSAAGVKFLPALLAGALFCPPVFTLIGFFAANRAGNFNQLMMLSVPFLFFMFLPVAGYTPLLPHPLWVCLPLGAGIELYRMAFQGFVLPRFLSCIASLLFWNLVLFLGVRRDARRIFPDEGINR